MASGKFTGIGVGPGDPELLTLKAVRALAAADVVIAPRTEKREDSIALSIARPHRLKNSVKAASARRYHAPRRAGANASPKHAA